VASYATLTVPVYADTRNFARGVSNAAKSSGDSAGKSFGSTFSAVLSAGAVIEAGKQLINFGKSAVQAFEGAEKTSARFNLAMKLIPGGSQATTNALLKQASALSKVTTYSAGTVKSVDAQLAAYHLTGQQIQTLTPIVLDYAARTGKSAEESSKVIGRALLGQGRGLKDVGVNFKNTGSEAGNFAEIVAQVGPKVAGTAQAMGGTTSGRLQILNNQFTALKVRIAAELVPAISNLLSLIMPMARFLMDNITPITILVGIIGGLVLVYKAWVLWQTLLDLAMSPMLPIYIAIAVAIAAIVAAVVVATVIFRNWTTIWNGIKTAVDFVWQGLQTAFNWVVANWPLLLGILSGPVGLAVVLIIKYWSTIWGFISRLPGMFISVAANAISAFKNTIVAVSAGIGLWVWNVVIQPIVIWVSGFPGRMLGLGQSAISWFRNGIAAFAAGIGPWAFNTIAQPIINFINQLPGRLRGLGGAIIDGLKGGIASAIGNIGNWVKTTIVDPIVNKVKEFFGISSPSKVMMGLGENVTQGFIKGIVSGHPQKVAEHIFGSMPKALAGVLKKGLISAAGLPEKALHALEGLGGDLAKLLGDAAGGILGSLGGFLKKGLNLGGLIGSLFGGGAKMPAGAGVARWQPMMLQVLSMFGRPDLLGVMMAQMNTESGGNPRAINLWDSNAAKGTPSMGLMQVIQPTFDAYAGPFRSRGIWDPMANMFAAVAYALSRYGARIGSVLAHGHGYDTGGFLPVGLSLALNKTGRPEAVLTAAQWDAVIGNGADEQTQLLRTIARLLAAGHRIDIDGEPIAAAVAAQTLYGVTA
jgi:hypothetical protein